MKIPEIIASLEELAKGDAPDEFVFEFLRAFGTPKATVTLLQKGQRNATPRSKPNAMLLKNKLFFESVLQGESPREVLEADQQEKGILRQKPRFMVVTDFETIAAYDTKRDEQFEASFATLAEHYAFFLPLAGLEIATHTDEAGVDVKAASKMAKLYDLICETNAVETPEQRHAINLFLTRLLFCYFAEDTGIFEPNAFSEAVGSFTQDDASDLQEFLTTLFRVMNLPPKDQGRAELPQHFRDFPYVNGNLFAGTTEEGYSAPRFTAKARRHLIELGGGLDWSEINPDIFGSMFQGVIDPEMRHDLGMHYTSVPNIMKVIVPLFLEELYEELDKVRGNEKKLQDLHNRLIRIRVFDPACGSGNFLIIAYRELRRFEMEIFKALEEASGAQELRLPQIHVNQFYGIEISDFAAEVAVLAMWLAEHQMNVQFKATFGSAPAALPLQDGANVVFGNAARLNWDEVCPKSEDLEIFILGNPPYLGARNQDVNQKADVYACFNGRPEHKDADYISCWFIKVADYIESSNQRSGFVSTNSVCQGDHVALLWPPILERLEITFAHQSFKWTNNASNQAAVICVIVGLGVPSRRPRKLYFGGIKKTCDNINAYLVAGPNVFVGKRRKALCFESKAVMGSMPRDGGNLILSRDEKSALVAAHPESERFIRFFGGAKEFIQHKRRHCLWLSDDERHEAEQIPEIKRRIDAVEKFRLDSPAKTTNGYATIPHKLAQRAHVDGRSIMFPRSTSERRDYIPLGEMNSDWIISDAAQAIYEPERHLFSVLSSRIHMVWVKAVAGRIKTDPRYSSEICYNNFPFPEISEKQLDSLSEKGEAILHARAKYPLKTIAELYDPDKMPEDLLQAHEENDAAVERCYRRRPFKHDEDRLEYLFNLYSEMIAAEENAQ